MAGVDAEMNGFLCACCDGQSTAVHLDHHFVSSVWLKREFSKHSDLIEMVEARAKAAFTEAVIQS